MPDGRTTWSRRTRRRRCPRGVPVDEWLDRFYRADDYVGGGACALFHGGELTGTAEDFGEALKTAFREGANDRVLFVPSSLNLPHAAVMTTEASRKRVSIVRKSSDALYVRRHVCGGPDSWDDTAIALTTQVSRLLGVCEAYMTRGVASVVRPEVEVALEVAMLTLRTLAFFCAHEPELSVRVRIRERARARSSVVLDVLEQQPRRREPLWRSQRRSWTHDWFLRWYTYCGEDGDVAVAVHHAMAEARTMSMPHKRRPPTTIT